MQLRLASLILVLSLGCKVGPAYAPPEIALPKSFHGETLTNVASESPKQDAFSRWWERFDDPLLNRFITEAIGANFNLKLAKARVREARAHLALARAGLLPSGNVTTTYMRERRSASSAAATTTTTPATSPSETETTGPRSTSTNTKPVNLYEAGFDSNWEIDVFGGTRRGIEVQSALLEASIDAERMVLISLLAEVAQNYILLRGTQQEREITLRNVAAQQETVNLQRMRRDEGIASDLTVAQAEAQLLTSQSRLPALEPLIQGAMHRLGILLAQEPGSLDTELLDPKPLPVVSAAVPPGLPSELLVRRPDVLEAERELAAATAQIGVAEADLFPRFYLTGAVGLRSDELHTLLERKNSFWAVGPRLSWEILGFPAILSNIEIQNARQEQALMQYLQAVFSSLEEVENALAAFHYEQERRAKLIEAVAANRRALSLAQELNDAGVVDFLNVLTEQEALYQTEDNLTQSDRQVALNLVALYKALGGGWD